MVKAAGRVVGYKPAPMKAPRVTRQRVAEVAARQPTIGEVLAEYGSVDKLKAMRFNIVKELSRKNFHTFLKEFAWPVLQPGTPFSDNWHIHVICEHMEAVSRGQIKRLLINLPFRMLKSTIISQAWPAWEWIDKPHLAYLTASYAKDVSTRDAVDSRRIIESPAYQAAWGDKFRMTSDQNVKTRYENDKKGGRIITATDAAGTGFGGNRIIVDDPVSAMEADSDVARASSIEWWKGTASTRLNNPQDDAIVVVHQRLNQNDLAGYILDNESKLGWEHLVLPMRYDPALRKTTSLGWADPRQNKGELLHPARLPEPTVAEMEARLGTYHVGAQLQQNPGSREGSIFKVTGWQFYHQHPRDMARSMEEIIWSWDLTFKDTVGSDYVSGLCIGRIGARRYLLVRINEQMSFSATRTQVEIAYKMAPFAYKLRAVLVEDKANGPAVVDSLKDVIPGLIAVSPSGGKVARANAVSPQHEALNFYLPSPLMPGFEWVNDWIDLFARFPGVKHDDDVDAWTQGINWFTTRENDNPDSPKPAVGGGRTFN